MADLSTISAIRRAAWQAGFRPVPVVGPDFKGNSPGKRPLAIAWQKEALSNPPKAVSDPPEFRTPNTGILCNGLRAIDIDVEDHSVAAELEALAFDMLGLAPVRGRSNSAKRLLLYRAAEGEPHKRTIKGAHGQIEVLGHGNQFVAYGVHPSGAPYEWRDGEDLRTTKLDSLSVVSEDELTTFFEAAALILGVDPKPAPAFVTTPVGGEASSAGASERPATMAAVERSAATQVGGSDFFRTVNTKALANLGSWVPSIFPGARRQPGTGAFRVSSKQLGRDLQEDLSLAPDGIVDFGVHDIGDANQGKRTPIDIAMAYGGQGDAVTAARWLADRLGIDVEAAWKRPETNIEILLPAAPASLPVIIDDEPDDDEAPPIDEALTHVPGVLGEMVDWIVATARRPNRRLALAAALPLCGTLLGRRMAGPTGGATHLYVICTYPTGAGKQHPLDAIERIMAALNLSRHVGPSQFMSMSALVRHVQRAPLSLCGQDEFGALLAKIGHPKASGHEQAISSILRQLWGKSFEPVRTPEYATTSSQVIACPALSLFGPTTAPELYAALKGKEVTNGFMNRFLVIDGGSRVAECEPTLSLRDPPQDFLAACHGLYEMGLPPTGNMRQAVDKQTAPDPRPVTLAWGDAKPVYDALVKRCEAKVDADPDTGPLYARTAEIALRLATIRACGQWSTALTSADMEWGATLAWASADKMASDAERYMTDPLGAAEFERRILTKIASAPNGEITMRTLHRSMQRSFRNADDLRRALDAMARSQIVAVESRAVKGGTQVVVRRL